MLRVATDCSGIEAPLEALARLGVPFDHVFASEIHRTAREWIRAKWGPRTLYHDVTARAHAEAEGCDLYVAGPPCTPFSGLNHRPFDATRPSIARALPAHGPARAPCPRSRPHTHPTGCAHR